MDQFLDRMRQLSRAGVRSAQTRTGRLLDLAPRVTPELLDSDQPWQLPQEWTRQCSELVSAQATDAVQVAMLTHSEMEIWFDRLRQAWARAAWGRKAA